MSTAFQAITVMGGVVPPSLLGRIQSGEVSDPLSLAPAGYHLIGTETVRDAASRTWMYLQDAWRAWRKSDAAKRPDGAGAGTGDARQKWLLILLRELGYGQVPSTQGGLNIGESSYPISHRWESVPIHLLGPGIDLDKRAPGEAGAARRAPQAMVQEFLNREENYLWAILSNGFQLRLLRDSTALAGSAYIEFDLENIFDADLYSEFQLLWQLCHQSRLAKRGGATATPADCWMEYWRSESMEAGARALGMLGLGVEKALGRLGTGFLRHADNRWLIEALHAGALTHRDFHKALLRTAYRLLFLFVVEDRGALLAPGASSEERHRYDSYFSTQRLRKMSRNRDGGPHTDLWRTQKLVLSALGGDGLSVLGLTALGGLFDPDPRAKKAEGQPQDDLLLGAELANHDFLKAIRSLGWVSGKSGRMQPVDYRHLGAEELGSVYESLLELVPRVNTETRTFELAHLAGNERKTTGSYYTPPNLVSALLDTALDPLLDQAVNEAGGATEAEARLLALTVCDPASGSGGFLVAAARRIARRVAEVRAGENEPKPEDVQTALHDVVERCIYGVDMNDLAAELAKVSLWLEAMQPGKPLGFLDARIKIGNSLFGATPALLADGVPDGAFVPIEGDDKKFASEIRKRNKAENTKSKKGGRFVHGGQDGFNFGGRQSAVAQLIAQRQELVKPVASASEARSRAAAYDKFDHSADMDSKRLHADAWCASFVWPLKSGAAEPPTSSVVRHLGESGTAVGYEATVDLVRTLANEYRFFHWYLEFPEIFGDPDSDEGYWPGGFTCMLGNPPWEKVKLQENEFFAARDASISVASTASIRKKLIQELKSDTTRPWIHAEFLEAKRKSEGLSLFLRLSGKYPHGGRGDVNTYVVFTEAFTLLVAAAGRVGVIVKTGIATDDTTKELFQNLTLTKRLVSLFDFENSKTLVKGRYFDSAHPSERFCLLTILGESGKAQTLRIGFSISDPENIDIESYVLESSDVELMNPISGTLPVFKFQQDVDLVRDIYNRISIFRDGGWQGLRYVRMLDVTNDSEKFELKEDALEEGFVEQNFGRMVHDTRCKLPVYEGKMVNLWDHRNADVVWSNGASQRQRQPSYLTPIQKKDPNRLATPGYWVDDSLLPDLAQRWMIGFASVTSPKNQRTFLVSPVPPSGVTNSLPLICVDDSPQKRMCLLANLSSFVFDYVARQKMGGINLNFFIVDQLPVIGAKEFSEECEWDQNVSFEGWIIHRAHELMYSAIDMNSLANDLGDSEEPFIWNDGRRDQLKAELDAAMFIAYGIRRVEIDYILDSFNLVSKRDISKHGEFRTKRLILEAYEAMHAAMDTGIPFESTLNPPPGQGPRHPAKETVS